MASTQLQRFAPIEQSRIKTRLKPHLHPLQHHRQLLTTKSSAICSKHIPKRKSNLQHLRRNSHDAPSKFLIQSAVFGIVGGIIESLTTKLVLEFVKDYV
jgi:hypothetical protein